MYIYNATGVKLKKTVNVSITDYAGNYIYENDELQFVNHPEGYATPVNATDYDSGFDYVYQYKDHLGNIRLSYTDNNGNLEIVEENNYYPFGLKHKGYNNMVSSNGNSTAQKFKYNGIELEESLGLNLYEMYARSYDPAIGRFTSIDPVVHFYQSTYTAFDNNPIFYADPSGTTSTAEWMRKNGITDDDLITIYQSSDDNSSSDSSQNEECCDDVVQFFNWMGSILGLNDYDIGDDIEHQMNQTKNPANNTVAPIDLGIKKWVVNNKDDLLLLSEVMQDVGDGATSVGTVLTMTVVFSEIGAPIAVAGSTVSTMGSSLEISVNMTVGEFESAANEAGWVAASKLTEMAIKKVPGGSQLSKKIAAQGAEVQLILIERVSKSND